jgi:ATP-dependent Clp endopeptidase proteolytic subunit ClpP
LAKESINNDEIDLHLHTIGGEVMDGNMIYNAVRKNSIPVNIYIDGLAASMGSIIAMAGHKIYMSENAFIMIHKPSGCTWGNALDMESSAKLLRDIEKQFVKVCKNRTKKTEAEINKWFEGDNWFSAEEALSLGMIDEITDKISMDNDIDKTQLANYKEVFNRYSAALTEKNDNNNLKPKQMNKQELIDELGLTGVTAQSSDADIKTAIKKQQDDAQARIDFLEADAKKAKTKSITDIVDAAIADGRISTAQKEHFIAVGETNGIDVLNSVLPASKPKTVTEQIQNNGKEAPANRDAWDWDTYQEKAPRDLERLEREDPQRFQKLYNAKYGI